MRNIFIGLLLVFLDFNLNLGNSTIALLPDFVGYIILSKGLLELEAESERFIKARPYSIGMAVYTGIIFLLDLFGISKLSQYIDFILGIVAMAVLLYISYIIVDGIKEMEVKHNVELNGEKLAYFWKWWALVSVVTFVLLLVPPLALVSVIVSVVVSILFLVAINTSKNLYYDKIGARW